MSLYSLYRPLIRPFMFMLDPEGAHNMVIKMGSMLSHGPLLSLFSQSVEERPCDVMGLHFKNPLGLAAGLDKNGDAIDYLGALGFGYLELGTVTPKAQFGNEKPRMFRIVEADGIINRMGFNNKGVDYLVSNLIKRKYKGIVGVSIGKNEVTSLNDAHLDYIYCMQKVYAYCDYIAINVSCPNTVGLTALQDLEPLSKLLKVLKEEQQKLELSYKKHVPLVVKMAPDLNTEQIEALCHSCLENNIEGISCTNTTTRRDIVYGLNHASEWGGLSGRPLYALSNDVLKKVNSIIEGKIPLIGIGGISNAIEAREKMSNGAELLQIYSSLIYKGPVVIRDIVNNL